MSTFKINIPDDRGVKYERFKYPAGETQVRLFGGFFEEIRQATEIEITFQPKDGEIMELALLMTAINPFLLMKTPRTLILPYLPYSRADRRFTEGDCFGLAAFGFMIDSMGFEKVQTYDAHNFETAKAYIQKLEEIPIDDFIKETIEDMGGKRGLTIILPDKGALRYEPLLKRLGLKYVVAGKTRNPQTGQLSGFTFPDVRIKKGLIIDDICDGGGTFVGLADEIKKTNPKAQLSLYVTHGIFSKGVGELKKRFKMVYATTTIKADPLFVKTEDLDG